MDSMMGGGAMTPEEARAYAEYIGGQSAFDEQNDEIQRQLKLAQALRTRQSQLHSTGLGGGLGAAGDLLFGIAGAQKMNQAHEEGNLLQQAKIAALRKMGAVANRRSLPGYDSANAAGGTLTDPMSGGAYIMPGPLYR